MRTATISALIFLSACGCQRDHEERVASPDGSYEAITERVNCGATTSFTTNVAIQRTGLRIPWTGRDEVFVVESEAPVWVRWTDATHVVIAYRTAPAGPKKKASGVIQVAYEECMGSATPPCGVQGELHPH
jgi:hypothetical protein